MLPDFELITHKFPNKDIKIYPIADVHLGAKEHLDREWKAFCTDILKDENAYIILAGDLVNNALKNSVSNVYEETMRPREQKRIMVEMLTPLRDRILAATSGNHERRSAKEADDDVTYDIMCKLDLEHLYRENIAVIKCKFGRDKIDGKRNPCYILAVTHGAGGGMLTGSAVNRAERFGYIWDGLDALVVGHTHKPFDTEPMKLKVDKQRNRVELVPFRVVSVSSWLAYGGYAVRKMLLPAGNTRHIMTLCGNHKEIRIES